MNDAPRLSREQVADQLWRWLPELYRARDARAAASAGAGAGPLRAFVGIVADELWRLRNLAEQQYDDHFIDSAQDWAIAYLADLVGTSVLFTGDAAQLREVAARNREDVKNTMRRRRRKGTLHALEGAAADAGGFGVLAVEMLSRTAAIAHPMHLGAAGAWTADLRRAEAIAALGTPFDRQRAFTDWRPPGPRRGLHRVQRLMVHAWPIGSLAMDEATPRLAGPGRWHFHPLGRDTALLAGGATPHLRAAVATRPGAAGADILNPQAQDMPIRTADLRAHPAAYIDTPLGFGLREDGIPLVGGSAPATPSLVPATGYGDLASVRGLVLADTGLYAAATEAEVAIVRLGALPNLSLDPPAPIPYSPGAAFASQFRLLADAGRVAVDTVTPGFGYTPGVEAGDPAAGPFQHPVLLLRLGNHGPAALAWPECELIVRSARGVALQVSLPAIAALAPGAARHFYVADDGSTYHARGDHGAGDPDRNPDSMLFGAYTAEHLACAAIGQRRARPGRPLGPARWRRVVARSLCCWERPLDPPLAPGEIAIDPERGRIVFAAGEAPQGDCTVDFRFGIGARIGAGPFARSAAPAAQRRITVAQRRNADFRTLQDAIDALIDGALVPQLIEILDSAVYDEALLVDGRLFPAGLAISAAAGQMPVLDHAQPLRVQDSTVGSLALEGLLIAGGTVEISGAVASVHLRHCTLDAINAGLLCQTAAAAALHLESCLCGPVAFGPAGGRIDAGDSVLQHPQARPGAGAGFDAVGAAGCELTARRCTLIGGVTAARASLSEVLCLGELALDDPAAGCMRHSRLPRGFAGPAFACTTAEPVFVSLRPAACGHAQLHPNSAAALLRGGEQGGEIGAMAGAGLPWRAAGAWQRIQEYTPAGLAPALAWALPQRPRSR